MILATNTPYSKFIKNDPKYKNKVRNWTDVFIFARYVTVVASLIWFFDANSRRADTQNSLAKMIIDMSPIYGSCKYKVTANKEKSNKILSAIGSRIAPKSLVNLYFRASQPSK